jgi:hypothetical protein
MKAVGHAMWYCAENGCALGPGGASACPAAPVRACARRDTTRERARADPRSQTEESGCAERWEDAEHAAKPACALVGAACVCGCGLRAAVPLRWRGVRLSVSHRAALGRNNSSGISAELRGCGQVPGSNVGAHQDLRFT